MLARLVRVTSTCTCRTTPAVARSVTLSATSTLRRTFSSSLPHREEPLPWFVDPSSLPAAPAEQGPTLATAPTPTAPPAHLDASLHPLHEHLSVSPFLDKHSITYINAREADPESTWVDWVVIATLRMGREGGLRGAIEGVRVFVRLCCATWQQLGCSALNTRCTDSPHLHQTARPHSDRLLALTTSFGVRSSLRLPPHHRPPHPTLQARSLPPSITLTS